MDVDASSPPIHHPMNLGPLILLHRASRLLTIAGSSQRRMSVRTRTQYHHHHHHHRPVCPPWLLDNDRSAMTPLAYEENFSAIVRLEWYRRYSTLPSLLGVELTGTGWRNMEHENALSINQKHMI